jgi:hypothetical protein
MGNNQALQLDPEAASTLFGGLLAALLAPLPPIVYGVLLITGALILLSLRTGVARAPPRHDSSSGKPNERFGSGRIAPQLMSRMALSRR